MRHPALTPDHMAVVTGGGKGIGFAIASALAMRGLSVVLIDTDAMALEQARSKLGASCARTFVADVADAAAMEAIAAAIYADFGAVHVLVNNAGITINGGAISNLEHWRSNLGVNLFGVLNGQIAFLPRMLAGGWPGMVVNLGSKEGITTPPGNAAYSVAKAGVKVLTEQLAHELRTTVGNQITAHLLVPGYTFTKMNFPDITAEAVKPPAPWTTDQVAQELLAGADAGRFYIICPDNDVSAELDAKRIAWAAGDMIEGRPALSRWHPDYAQAFAAFANSSGALSSYRNVQDLHWGTWG